MLDELLAEEKMPDEYSNKTQVHISLYPYCYVGQSPYLSSLDTPISIIIEKQILIWYRWYCVMIVEEKDTANALLVVHTIQSSFRCSFHIIAE